MGLLRKLQVYKGRTILCKPSVPAAVLSGIRTSPSSQKQKYGIIQVICFGNNAFEIDLIALQDRKSSPGHAGWFGFWRRRTARLIR